MNDNQLTCEPGLVEPFLQEKLSDDEQRAFESHLDGCSECRDRLEAAAASDEIWTGVRESLSDVPFEFVEEPERETGGAAFSHIAVLKLLAPIDNDRMLGRLGTYEIAGVVGSGGMGVVLKAFDATLNRFVAIKVLAPHLGCSGAARQRFAREAQAAAAVVHDNVIEIHGVADADGLPYLVMPYVPGPSLQRRIDDHGPLAVVEILRIGMQAASGLAAAHAQGLVHRDVKPANILLADGIERMKLTDFGLARAADDASLTMTGIIAGTPQYMSPEQARGASIDQRSDLFSLGSVLYAMCTGREPFRAETSYGVLRRITDDDPQPIQEINSEIPDWLCRIVARLMSKAAGDRFESAQEVALLLKDCLAHVQQPEIVVLPDQKIPVAVVRNNPPQNAPSPRESRRSFSSGVIAMFAGAGLSLLGMVLWQATGAPDIAGGWRGDDWGEVVLRVSKQGGYHGLFADARTERSGTLHVEWSRLERRFNGTWKEGDERHGKLSIRIVDDSIRGAWTTDTQDDGATATPKLADLAWTRAKPREPTPAAPPTPKSDFGSPTRMAQFETADRVKSIASSPDGKLVAVANGVASFPITGDWKRTVSLYEPVTGKKVVSVQLNTGDEVDALAATEGLKHFEVGPLVFSPDGSQLAIATGLGQVKLFEARTGKLIQSFDDKVTRLKERGIPKTLDALPRAMGGVASLAFSPDGSLLAMCGSSFDDFARAWGPLERLGRRAIGPDRLKVWEVKTGTLKHDLVAHSHAESVAFSPDGTMLASTGFGNSGSGVVIWNPLDGSKLRTIETRSNGGTRAVAFSPDSSRIVIGSQQFDKANDTSTGVVMLAYPRSGIVEWQRRIPWARPVGFVLDGGHIAVLAGGKSIQFIETETGRTTLEISTAGAPGSEHWNDFSTAAGGRMLAIGGTGPEKKGSVEVWAFPGIFNQTTKPEPLPSTPRANPNF